MGTFLGWPIKQPSNLGKLIVFVTLSLVLMVLDARRAPDMRVLRADAGRAVYPLKILASLPLAFEQRAARALRVNSELKRANERLRDQMVPLRAKLLRLKALQSEVAHLTALLKGRRPRGYRETLVRILAVSSGPFTQRLTIDAGRAGHVFVGQPVIDAHGIVGQVIKVGALTSQVMLVTDPDSGVPVVSARNGLRAIVFGTGSADRLKVPYLTVTADIRPGDILLSSGLGGVYPRGYPVARVTAVTSNPNLAFLKVRATPLAHLDYHTHLLLLWPRPHRGARRFPWTTRSRSHSAR